MDTFTEAQHIHIVNEQTSSVYTKIRSILIKATRNIDKFAKNIMR